MATNSIKFFDHLEQPYLCLSWYVSGKQALPMAERIASKLGLTRSNSTPSLGNLLADWRSVLAQEWFASVQLYEIPGEHQPVEEAKVALVQVIQTGFSTQTDQLSQLWLQLRTNMDWVFTDALVRQVNPSESDQPTIPANPLPYQILGYTVIYGASLPESVSIDPEKQYTLPSDLLLSVQNYAANNALALAQSPLYVDRLAVPAGILTLATVPTGLHQKAGMVYWLVTTKQHTDSLFRQWCVSPTALLSQIDSLAHKIFLQTFEFTPYRRQLNLTLNELLTANRGLLTDGAGGELLDNRKDPLRSGLALLQRYLPDAYSIFISQQQQLANMHIIQTTIIRNEVTAHIAKLMQNHVTNMRLFTDKLKTVREAAQTSLTFYQTYLAEQEQKNQYRFQLLLSFLGIGLAVLQVYPSEGAIETIRYFSSPTKCPSTGEIVFTRLLLAVLTPVLIISLFQWLKHLTAMLNQHWKRKR